MAITLSVLQPAPARQADGDKAGPRPTPAKKKNSASETGKPRNDVADSAPSAELTPAQKSAGEEFQQAEKLRKEGRFPEAVKKGEAALESAKKAFGPNHVEIGAFLTSLALSHQALGQFARAEPMLQSALDLQTSKLGENHLRAAPTLNNLASLYLATGRLDKAEVFFERSLKIQQDKRGPNHPLVATAYNNLGLIYQSTSRPDKAETNFKHSLSIRESQLGKDHIDTATSLTNLAMLYEDQRRYREAEPLYRRGLSIRTKKLGEDHPETAHSLSNLGSLLSSTGRKREAARLIKLALKIRQTKLGADHPSVARTMYSLALLHVATGRLAEAADLLDQARRFDRRHVARTLAGLSEFDQAQFLGGAERADLHLTLSLALHFRNDAELAGRSACWLLNGKGLGQEVAAASVQLLQAMDNPELAVPARELRDIRQQLAGLSIIDPPPAQEPARRKRIADLTAREETLALKLRQAGAVAKPDVPWVEPADVRRKMPTSAVLIDIARFQDLDVQANAWKQGRYAAWITPQEGAVCVVDLGPAEAIDAAVTAARDALVTAPKLIMTRGELEAEQSLRGPLEVLARRVLHPLLPHTGDADQLIISPDAGLWLVPWSALPMPDGSYAIEKLTIRYAISGRDLLRPPPALSGPVSRPLVLADPDFDLGRPTAPRKSTPPRPRPTPDSRGGLKLGAIRRLPGTAAEAEAIRTKLQQFTGSVPRVLTGAQAIEKAFKSVKNPQVLVVSTHGFFLADADENLAPGAHVGAKRSPNRARNPLLRCGLLLAGCNFSNESGNGDDGVLTGLEVVGADLRGCELVVLSACETGLGEVRNGEGVAGLRQAFQLAGAAAVVATLWQVPDLQSAQLMSGFFDHLAGKKGKAAALRDAQRDMIQARRQKHGAAHPYFWAAFTVTGR